jgi:Zn finger protein HypA/HybF involved in hydrogenase expression
MRCSRTCEDCNRKYTIEYDESDGTPEFCPLCGSESDSTTWGEEDILEVDVDIQDHLDGEIEDF